MAVLYRGLSLFSFVVASCGAMDFPDSASNYRSSGKGADGIGGSAESNFDLVKCGFDLTKPGSNVTSRRMSMVPQSITTTGIFGFKNTFKISGLSITEDSLSRSVMTFSAQSNPSSNVAEVVAALETLHAGLSGDVLAPVERAKIGETYPDWRGVFCSFQPIQKIERGSAGKIIIELDKPLPLTPLIISDVGRLNLEMGVKRAWNAIGAKVVESSDPEVPVGSSWTGRAFSQPVPGNIQVDGPAGPVNVAVPLAVKMTYDFGNPKTNLALGLPSSITWYIDDGTKSLRLTQVDFGNGVLVNYLPDK